MDSIIRALIVYLMLLIIFRVAGKRALSQTTTFDLVLALVISESIQQALLDNDPSLTHATLVVIGLVGFDILVSYAAHRSSTLRKLLEGSPVVLIEAGRMHPKYMDRERVGESEIMQSARDKHGLARLEQVAYAVVEQSGDITIVPTEKLAGA
ncbi:MAG TPA: YetF domain-containing protein [Longimicrobiales bacterium]|nr:YetF domain-containing protein [Longimicrobiales bacterium]